MRKTLIGTSCCLMLVLWLSAAVQAQPGGRGMGRGMFSRVMLLRMEDVQKELELSDSQLDDLQAIFDELPQFGPGGQRGERGERGEGGEGRRAGADALRQAEEKALKILDEDQRDRLLGIFIWVAGANAYVDDEVVKRAGIDEDVRAKINDLLASSREEMGALMQELRDSGADREEIQQEMAKFREELEKDARDLLSKEQQAKIDQLKGKKFELPMFGRGRGG